jgi:hypothetical protein
LQDGHCDPGDPDGSVNGCPNNVIVAAAKTKRRKRPHTAERCHAAMLLAITATWKNKFEPNSHHALLILSKLKPEISDDDALIQETYEVLTAMPCHKFYSVATFAHGHVNAETENRATASGHFHVNVPLEFGTGLELMSCVHDYLHAHYARCYAIEA